MAIGKYATFRSLDVNGTEAEIKGAPGLLHGWYITNTGSSVVYVKFYNDTADNVTVGTDTPVDTFAIPAGAAANAEFRGGIEFDTAICIAATTGVIDLDMTSPGANEVIANIYYL